MKMRDLENNWQRFKQKGMDAPPFLVDVVINDSNYEETLIDNGSSAYACVSEKFIKRHGCPTIPITKRSCEGYIKDLKTTIDRVTTFHIDVGGVKEQIWAYCCPDLMHEMILGRAWMIRNGVQINEEKERLEFAWSKITIPSKDQFQEIKAPTMVAASTFAGLLRRSQKQDHDDEDRTQFFKATMADIEKALRPKCQVNVKEHLPEWLSHMEQLFSQDKANTLPPYRPGFDHKIPLEVDKKGKEQALPWSPLYSMPREELLVLRRTLTDLLDKNFIRVSKSDAGAPVLFARKPSGGLRFCVDYRALNAMTKKDRYPLPLITETLRALSQALWFSKVDVSQAFHHIRIAQGEEWKTAFRTRYGSYEWNVTPFGLTGAPATFQRYINWILRDYLDEFCTAYIDDVLIYTSGTREDHREKVKLVLQRLNNAGLNLDITKCEFETKSTKYLGYIVEVGRGLRMDPEKVKAIQEWAEPTTVKGVRSFLGFANYYRSFIKGYSDVVLPLTRLTRKGEKFTFTEECRDAFECLKGLFVREPILAAFDPDRDTTLEPDASNWAVGGVLTQRGDDGKFRPVAYFSRKNLPAECNYTIHDKELMAIIKCLEEWDAMVRSLREPLTILTDHRNLEHFMKIRKLNERQIRWGQTLSNYNYTLRYRPGKHAVIPDALSRREQDMPKEADARLEDRHQRLLPSWGMVTRALPLATGGPSEEHNLDPLSNTINHDKEAPLSYGPEGGGSQAVTANQNEGPFGSDEELQQLWETALETDQTYSIIKNTVQSTATTWPKELKMRGVELSECSINDSGWVTFRDRLWLPNNEPLRTAIIQKTHDSSISGHPGRDATYAMLARQFFWPGCSHDVRRFVNNCDVCGRTTIWRQRKWGLLKPLPIPQRPWRSISMDFITDLPNVDGQQACLVVTDRLTKGVMFIPVQAMTAEGTADLFISNVYRRHGLPSDIISDRGTQWVNAFWKRVCELLGIKRRLSTAYRPQTDGGTERANQEVQHYVRIFVNYDQSDWPQMLAHAELAVNNRANSTTGFSPFFLEHGYNVEPIQLTDDTRSSGSTQNPVLRGEEFVSKLKEAHEFAEAALALAQETQERFYNQGHDPSFRFQVGDKVWLNLKNVRTERPMKKLDWIHSKHTVTEVIGTHNYRLDVPRGIHNVFHVTLLRPAPDNAFPSQHNDDTQPPAIIGESGQQEFFIEEILGTRRQRRGRGWRNEAHVKWVGYTDTTWEPLSEVEDTVAYERFLARP